MSLKDRIHRAETGESEDQRVLRNKFRILDNPFPAAGQPFGHPHLESEIDQLIISDIQEFENSHKTQILVIEGTQGVGKTNLLNYYQNELEDLYQDDKGFYIIRYYPDPEPSFDAIIRRIFQALGDDHIKKIAQKLSNLGSIERSTIIDTAKSHEVRTVLHHLAKKGKNGDDQLDSISEAAMEWLLGLRVLNKHKELGIRFRLDTVESKNQVLRDIVYVSVQLQILRGIFLLLDELEKQDYSLSTTPVIRYLSAIRALIDALPTYLFLAMAITPEARRRYFTMLPAIAGRLQNVYALTPLSDPPEAISLYNLYLSEAQSKTNIGVIGKSKNTKPEALFTADEITEIFNDLSQRSAIKGIKGVTQRDFLNHLHLLTKKRFEEISKLKKGTT